MIVFKLFKFKLKIVFMICGCADYGLPPSADGGFLWASRVIKVIVCSGVNVILINVIKIIFKKSQVRCCDSKEGCLETGNQQIVWCRVTHFRLWFYMIRFLIYDYAAIPCDIIPQLFNVSIYLPIFQQLPLCDTLISLSRSNESHVLPLNSTSMSVESNKKNWNATSK